MHHSSCLPRTCKALPKDAIVLGLCWFAYLTSYCGRFSFAATLVDIGTQAHLTNAQLGSVSTAFFIAYAMGQFVNSLLVGRVKPERVIVGVLLGSMAVNSAFPFLTSLPAMQASWFLNGILQSALWVNIISCLDQRVSTAYLPRAMVLMHTVGAAGLAAAYWLSALCIAWLNWRVMFWLSAGIMLLAAILWVLISQRWGKSSISITVHRPTRGSFFTTVRVVLACGGVAALIGCIANGMLRDGIATWLPVYVKQQYDLSAALSVFISSFVPILQIAGAFLAGMLFRRTRSALRSAAFFFACAAIALGACIAPLPLWMCITMFAIASIAMTAVNACIISFFAIGFQNRGMMPTVTGVLNASVYIGSALCTTAMGFLSQQYSWTLVIGVLCVTAIFAGVATGSYTVMGKDKAY